MKKGLILLFLLLLPLVVSAQEITILGTQYSLMVVLPFALMLLVLFFFLLVVLRDKIQSTKKIKFNFKFGLFKKKRKHAEKAPKPIINFIKDLTSLKRNIHKLSNRNALDEISNLTKEYIKDKHDIKNEFALSELSTLIKGHVKEIKIGSIISELKFGEKTVTKNQIEDLLSGLTTLIHPIHKEEPKKYFKLPRFHFKLTKQPHHKKEPKLKPLKPKYLEIKPSGLFFIRKLINNYKIKLEERKSERLLTKLKPIKQKKHLKPEYIEIKPRKYFTIKKLIDNYKQNLKEKKSEKLLKKIKHDKKKSLLTKILLTKHQTRVRQNKLSHLLRKTQKYIKRRKIDLAKRSFSKAILIYYKLPLEQEELFTARLNILSKNLKTMHPKKELHNITDKIIKLKEDKKIHTKESIEVMNQFKEVLKEEFVPKEKQKLQNELTEFQPTIEIVGSKLSKLDLRPKQVKIPSKRTSLTLQKLIKEENQIYGKLHHIEIKELERFKQKHPVSEPKKYISKYHDFLKKIEPKPHKSKKLDSLSQIENKIKQKILEAN